VLRQHGLDHRAVAGLALHVGVVEDQRRLVADAGLAAGLHGELGVLLQVRRLLLGLADALQVEAPHLLVGSGEHEPLQVDGLVVGLEHRQIGVARHVPAVAARRGPGRLAAVGRVEAVGAPGDDEARGEPRHVPFPGRHRHLVEVVDVEREPPLRRGEAAEVQQVAVAAGHDLQAGRRGEGRSCAITDAAPRKKAKGLAIMRP